MREYDAGRHDVRLYCVDILDHPSELRERYDVVIGFFTLHHLHDLESSFEATSGLVRSGGTIAFLEPNALNILYYVQIVVTPRMTWEGNRGVGRMRKGVVFDTMRRAGLQDLRLHRFGFFPPFVSNRRWGGALQAVLERVRLWEALLPSQLFKGPDRDEAR